MISASKKNVFLKLTILSICLLWLYLPVFQKLIEDWMSLPDFSHGAIVPLFSLYIVWKKRKELESAPIDPSWFGVVFLLLGLLLFNLGNLAAENFTVRISFLAVLAGIILFLFGKTHLKLLSFPILFMLLMIPIPSIILQKITFPMQLFASSVATHSLMFIGIPVLREGNIIHLATTSLQVAEACSGIRSLIALVTLGVIYAYFFQKILWKRVVLVAACFPIAIIVNSLRVSITGLLADHYGDSIAQGFFHGFSGYLLFILTLSMLYIISIGLSHLGRPSQR